MDFNFDEYYKKIQQVNYNKNLIELGVINTMKAGVTEFGTRIKNARKIREIDAEAFDYCKLALRTMKGFIKYKENVFNLK